MRGLIVMGMFVASLANATFSDFEETRELNLHAKGIGSLSIEAGAGSIDDGSGSITVRGVTGSVTIDDGSGGIKVTDVENDLIITGDGSGGVSFKDVRGQVEQQET